MTLPAPRLAGAALTAASAFWWVMALLGQWAFLIYIVAFYGVSTAGGNLQLWKRNTFLFKGYVPGDTAGNLAFAAHALLAAYVAFGGALQLIPQIRRHAPRFHRWNGRVFMVTALGVSLTGFYMVWVRHANPFLEGAIATSLNGVLIIAFAVLAWRAILAGDIARHRRWALRLFIVANGQWFIRIGFFTWIMFTQLAGTGKHIGPFILVWNFACYLLPLAVLEFYLRVKESRRAGPRYAMASALVVLTLLMSVGIFGIAMFMWWPLLAKV
jgi:uncharacterized membrane protein